MSKKMVSFIIVNFNNSLSTEKMLSSILDLKKQECIKNVVVVDNASAVNQLSRLRDVCCAFEEHFPVKLIESKKNLGYSGGLNFGLREANISQSDFIVVCNNDLEIDRNFVEILANYSTDTKCHVIFPDVISDGGVHENPRYIDRVSRLRKLSYQIYYLNFVIAVLMETMLGMVRRIVKPKKLRDYKYPTKCELGVGACIILTRNFFKHYTKLDDRVFLWGEEALLASMVRRAGGFQFYEPELKVYHKAHSTVSKITKLEKYRMMKNSYRIFKSHL